MRHRARKRIGAAFGSLALLGAAAVSADFLALSARPASAACSAAPAPLDPIETAISFLDTAVAGKQAGQAYRLATPALRGRSSCADWAAGRTPIERFGTIDWSRSAYRVVAGGTGQLVLKVFLWSATNKDDVKAYLMELRQPEGSQRWQVGFWQRTPLKPGDLNIAGPKL